MSDVPIRARRGHLTGFALNRSRIADQWRAGYARAMQLEMNAYVRLVANAAAAGAVFPTDATADAQRRYHATKRRWIYRMVQAGFEWAEQEVLPAVTAASKTARSWQGKARAAPIGPEVVIGGVTRTNTRQRVEEFLLRGDFPRIDAWVQTTAAAEMATTAARLAKVWRDAAASRDPETGVAWTPAQISRAIRARGLAASEVRADMLARTGTIWALNEGAQQRYIIAGVVEVEWIVTSDDVLCPYCASMNHQVVAVSEPFVKGSRLTVSLGGGRTGTLKTIGGIEHPPLHPNCRCTLVPVITDLR